MGKQQPIYSSIDAENENFVLNTYFSICVVSLATPTPGEIEMKNMPVTMVSIKG